MRLTTSSVLLAAASCANAVTVYLAGDSTMTAAGNNDGTAGEKYLGNRSHITKLIGSGDV